MKREPAVVDVEKGLVIHGRIATTPPKRDAACAYKKNVKNKQAGARIGLKLCGGGQEDKTETADRKSVVAC
jgi:hypothetical protein